ncbi:hypothetical protein PMAYCL1PPCAC_05477, partial [Pristionchus mayeri]
MICPDVSPTYTLRKLIAKVENEVIFLFVVNRCKVAALFPAIAFCVIVRYGHELSCEKAIERVGLVTVSPIRRLC